MNTTEPFGTARRILAALSIAVAVLSLAGALLLWLPSGGGFLPDLGKALALLLLGAGNMLCLLLNLGYLKLARGPAWLRAVAGLQALPALFFCYVLGKEIVNGYLNERAYGQTDAIGQAIRQDDPSRYAQAYAECGRRCGEYFPRERQLLVAVRHRAPRVAARLLSEGVQVRGGLGEPTIDLRTCEGDYLPLVGALSLAVANDDADMLQLLLPASDAASRRGAVWMAAVLDRLERLRQMEAAGLSLSIRGRLLDENATLLVAAASGAALRTGRWLIESHGMPVHALQGPDRHAGPSPMSALMHFMLDTGSPRVQPFLALLLEHGADVDERRRDGATWLQEAVRVQDGRMAALLLDAGADRQALDPEQASALRALLASEPRPRHRTETADCIPVS